MIRLALKNPYLVLVLVLMVAVIGAISMARIPADLLPTYKTSAVQIVTFYPGMPPEVMEGDIMSRLQRWTGQSSGIEHQEAKAMQGVCIVKDFFHPEVSSSEALAQVSMYAMSDMFYLPPGTIPPMVMPFDPTASVPLCLVSVSNPDMNDSELYDIAYKNLRNNLQSISGVIAPAVNGGALRRILAYVDPEKLRAYNISILEVHAALRRQNVLIPAGSAKIGDKEFYIYTNAIPDEVATLNDAPIKIGANGEPVLFSDVGEVQDSKQIQSNIVRVNGRTLVYVPVYRQPGSNTIEIVDSIKEKLGEILARLQEETRLPDGTPDPKMANLTLNVVMDQSVKVRESVNALWVAGILGAVFAGLVVLFFLRNLASTFVIILAIPIAILTSLIGLYFTGNTINAMTLGGLALAVGILIDQAIVVIDNIERHMNMGTKGPLQAALDGTREVSVPLFVSTVTFIVVFFPVIFLSGLAKYLFAPLSMAVLFAVIASYLIAIFFVPVAAAKFMRPKKKGTANGGNADGSSDSVGQQPPTEQLNWLVRGYRVLLLGSLRRKWWILSTAAVLFVGSMWLMSNIGRELFPPVDSGQFTVYVRAPSGTRIELSEDYIKQIENMIVEEVGDPAPDNPTADTVYPVTRNKFAGGANRTLTDDEVANATKASNCETLISNIGVLLDWPAAYSPNTGAMDSFILVELKQNPGAPDVFEIVSRLRKRLNKEFPNIEFAFNTGGILTAALNMGEPSPIHLQIAGRDIETAQGIARELVAAVKRVEGTTDVRIAQRADYPMIEVEIDRVAAADRGVTPELVMKSLVSATNSSINFDPAFWINPQNGNHYFLGTQYFEEKINSLDTLRYISVKGSEDGSPIVYLQDVAKLHTNRKVPNVINHRNIVRVTDVFANVETGYDLGSVVANIERELQKSDATLKLRPVKDSRSAAAKYPEWLQATLAAVGLNEPTRYAIEGSDYSGFMVEMQGEVRSMRDSFVDFTLGMVLATLLVYLVMVGQFRSFVDPFIVLVTVPLGFIGVAAILYLTNTRLNIQSFMGIIMMIGIVVEYTIVLLDFANHRLSEGATVSEAIVDAAIVRFRPILMTSVTTILALLPMAIGFAGGEADVPLARTIVGGVIAATLLPKFVVPCLYVIIKREPKQEEPEPGWA
jgi:multidrug efflux pump subunit AcrB